MNQKLQRLTDAFADWCDRRNVPYSVAVDEDDLQGYLVFKSHQRLVPQLLTALAPVLATENLHVKQHRTRQGPVLAFSLVALSEHYLEHLLPTKPHSAYLGQLDRIFEGELPKPPVAAPAGAKPISKPGAAAGATLPKSPPITGKRRTGEQHDVRDTAIGQRPPSESTLFGKHLVEALDGVGSEFQPKDVMARIRSAIDKLGIRQRLQQAGITAKISDDGLYLHFYAGGEGGKNGREIIRYFIQELADPAKLEEALYHLIDVAYGRAPGAGKLEQEVRRQEEKNLSQVAKQYALANQAQAQPEPGPASGGGVQPPAESFDAKIDAVFEGYPGTKENPPDNAAWVSPETRTWRRENNMPIPKKPVTLVKKEVDQLPPHLQNDPAVQASRRRRRPSAKPVPATEDLDGALDAVFEEGPAKLDTNTTPHAQIQQMLTALSKLLSADPYDQRAAQSVKAQFNNLTKRFGKKAGEFWAERAIKLIQNARKQKAAFQAVGKEGLERRVEAIFESESSPVCIEFTGDETTKVYDLLVAVSKGDDRDLNEGIIGFGNTKPDSCFVDFVDQARADKFTTLLRAN